MDERTLRSIKGLFIENFFSVCTDGSHLDGEGFDLSWIDGDIYGEIKYQRQNGKTITRKLKNSLSLNGRPECDIGFDVLLVACPDYVRCFFSDELDGLVYRVSDGFEFRTLKTDGHLIAECNLPGNVTFERDGETLGEKINRFIKEETARIVQTGPYRPVIREIPSRSGSRRRQQNQHQTIMAR